MGGRQDALAHLGKAQEFLEAAETANREGWTNVATSNAVTAGINAKDAICFLLSGQSIAADNHREAVSELRRLGDETKDAATAPRSAAGPQGPSPVRPARREQDRCGGRPSASPPPRGHGNASGRGLTCPRPRSRHFPWIESVYGGIHHHLDGASGDELAPAHLEAGNVAAGRELVDEVRGQPPVTPFDDLGPEVGGSGGASAPVELGSGGRHLRLE